jgi:hypothetical protein
MKGSIIAEMIAQRFRVARKLTASTVTGSLIPRLPCGTALGLF